MNRFSRNRLADCQLKRRTFFDLRVLILPLKRGL